MPLVSVVIPAYNEEKDIEECLKSLKKQTLKNIEIILVDDGSTDNTIKVASKYKIKILKQNHGGPGRARNLGARHARGRILVFIDADMHFDKNYLKNLITPILKDKKIIGTTHDYEIATNTDNPWSKLYGVVRVGKKNAHEVRIFRAVRRDKFLELGGFDPKYGYADDQTFWYKYRIKPVVAKNTTCYHKNPDTLEATYKQARWIGKSWKERFKVFKIPIINYLAVIALYLLYIPLFIVKAFKVRMEDITLGQKLIYYRIKFLGYINGVAEAVFFNRVWR